jgi:hypothetical protein
LEESGEDLKRIYRPKEKAAPRVSQGDGECLHPLMISSNYKQDSERARILAKLKTNDDWSGQQTDANGNAIDESVLEYHFTDFREKLTLSRKTNQFQFDGKLHMPKTEEESIKWVVQQFELANEPERQPKSHEPIRDVIRSLLKPKNWYRLKQQNTNQPNHIEAKRRERIKDELLQIYYWFNFKPLAY